MLKLIDGYCALIEEIEPIKLKIFNPIKDVYIEGEDNDPEKDKDTIFDKILSRFSTFRLVMFGLGAVILLVFFAIVYVFFFQT